MAFEVGWRALGILALVPLLPFLAFVLIVWAQIAASAPVLAVNLLLPPLVFPVAPPPLPPSLPELLPAPLPFLAALSELRSPLSPL